MPSPASQPLPTLVDNDLVLRAAAQADAAPLLAMLREPAVAEWWVDNDLASISDELRGQFAVEIGGVLAGLVEAHDETEPAFPVVAFDIFLGTRFHGQGYGPRALRLAIDHFIDLGHHRFTIDPAVDNTAAVRAYGAVGFRRVGILREAERAPSGAWRDAILMDLLASEVSPR